MLSAIETLLEFWNILLGSEIMIYTDYINNVNLLTKHVSKCIQYWRWLIEEFSPKFVYLKGLANNLADALSRLDRGKDIAQALYILDTEIDVVKLFNNVSQAKIFNSAADENIPEYVYLLSAQLIAQEQ